jgi:hypothetical protein
MTHLTPFGSTSKDLCHMTHLTHPSFVSLLSGISPGSSI